MKRSFTSGIAAVLALSLGIVSCTNNSASELEKTLDELKKESEKITYVEQTNDSIDFYLILPDYMSETSELDPGRPFQYMNAVKEHYIVASSEALADVKPLIEVMDYEGETFLDKYVSYNKGVINEGVKISKEEPVKKTTINGFKAQTLQFDGTVEGISEPISYFTTFIEGKDNVYFIMLWTLESRKDDFKEIADKVVKSFHVKKK